MNLKLSLKLMSGMIALVVVPLVAGCSNNPTTGRSQFNMLSRSEEIAIGEEAKGPITTEYGGEVASAVAQGYLTEIGQKLAAFSEGENPSLPWEFVLLDSDVVNAFALPGGKTFITKALVEKLSDEAELAFIMGHEIGHVTARHQNEQISRQLGTSVILAGIGVAAGQSDNSIVQQAVPAIVGGAGGLYLLSYGRNQELEADKLGMRYMVRAGYDPKAARDAMGVLKELASGGDRPPEFLSTHPHPESRIEEINARLRGQYAAQASDASFQRYASRYQNRMLKQVALAWPRVPSGGGEFAVHDTSSWCGICANGHDESVSR